jgi:hypothetical protein
MRVRVVVPLMSLVAACVDTAGEAAGTTQSADELTQTLAPAADAYVRSGTSAGRNFGTATGLRVDSDDNGDQLVAYLRFVLPAGGTLLSAKLRLYVANPAAESPADLLEISNASWSETAITWNNRPAIDGALIKTVGGVGKGSWLEIDVTPFANLGEPLSLVLRPRSADGILVNSKDAAKNRPQLVLTLTSCGDAVCNGGETCSSCAQDCGECPAVCGDDECNGTETCSSCAQDCGACPATNTPYSGSPVSLPGSVEAAYFDNGAATFAYSDTTAGNSGDATFRNPTDVDIKLNGGSYAVGWLAKGEWLAYTVNVAQSGSYTLRVRAASADTDGGVLRVEFDDLDVTGPLTVPNTGSYTTWTSVQKSVSLSAGTQVMRLVVEDGFFDLDSLEVASAAAACGDDACNGSETCSSCAQDCGTCAPACGDGTCNTGEDCATCQADCGTCASAGPGAGKTSYTCPSGATQIQVSDDIDAKINSAPSGATLCVFGPHRASASIGLKSGQRLIGIGTNARISGAQVLSGWQSAGSGVWVYNGSLATRQNQMVEPLGHAATSCYPVSNYQDDVFYDDKRMMRVLSLDQLKGIAPPPRGQPAQPTAGEFGKFFFDYANDKIYIDKDPTNAVVDLSVIDNLVLANGATDVVLQNITFEKAMSRVIDGRSGRGWRFEDLTIRFAHNIGLHGGAGTQAKRGLILRTLITNNGQYGINSGGANWVTIQDSELSWNNIANYRKDNGDGTCGGYWHAGAVKYVQIKGTATDPGLKVINLESHHNVSDGFWTDINNQYVLVQGGRFHHNERNGYFHEISCDAEFTGVEFDHNGSPIKNPDILTSLVGHGLLLNNSNNVKIHDNLFHDNFGGVLLQWSQRTGVECHGGTDASYGLKNNRVLDNDIYVCKATSGGRGATLASRNNLYQGNRWRVPSLTGAYWLDSGSAKTWSQWNAAGEDTAGTHTSPCTFP